jgi:hypothetical protein
MMLSTAISKTRPRGRSSQKLSSPMEQDDSTASCLLTNLHPTGDRTGTSKSSPTDAAGRLGQPVQQREREEALEDAGRAPRCPGASVASAVGGGRFAGASDAVTPQRRRASAGGLPLTKGWRAW